METSSIVLCLRILAAIGALAAGLGAAVFVVTLLQGLPPVATPATSSAAAPTPAATTAPPSVNAASFPTPPRGSIVLGSEAGPNALGLAVVPGKRSVGLQASVIDPNGAGVKGVAVRFDVRGSRSATVTATACGAGCYRATAPVARPRAVTVAVGARRVEFAMPTLWPSPPATKLVEQATRVYKSLRTLVIHDSLGDGHVRLTTIYRIVAPDRLTYSIRNGGDAVIIGDARWDRPAGSSRWIASVQTPITQPTPYWVEIEDAHLLGTVAFAGRPAWKVSFFDPDTPGWYTLVIDKATLHTMEMLMTAHAHFMHDTYGSFNAPLKIVPPT